MIKRTLFQELKEHLSQKEISIIVGPRQAGKTTLMRLLESDLKRRGEKTVFINLDIEADKRFLTSQADLIRKIELEIGKERGFVFIDEIQRKENAGVFLKGIYDMNLPLDRYTTRSQGAQAPYKFVVSGSGSVELKEKIHESLVGRKRVFELPTLTFLEFVNFKTDYKYEDRLSRFFSVEREQTKNLLVEYLNFGGYPRVVLAETLSEKQKVIDEIYQSYLQRDISYLLKIRKTESFDNLVKLVASQVGNLVNFSKTSSTLGISTKTLKDYLWYLQKTFILRRTNPYFRNIRKEITKSPIFYFYDLGLRNYALGRLGSIQQSQELGFLFQNFVLNILQDKIRYQSAKIGFWRTKDKAEVDFVVDFGTEQIPIEVKYKRLEELETTRSLKSFITRYQPRKALVVNLELEKQTEINKTAVCALPFYKLLLEDLG